MSSWKQAVAQAFDAADGYDRAATIQAVVAQRLADGIAARSEAPCRRVLEIGCGTGLLTQALRSRLATGQSLVTDIAPAMVARCRRRLGGAPGLNFAVMDGERPCLAQEAGFDLICSSLAAQWFEDLPGALEQLAGLLTPGGLLAVATLTAGTFREWSGARAACALPHATPTFPTERTLRRLRFDACTSQIVAETLSEAHPDGHSFLRALRAIGAQTPADGRVPLSAGALRRVLRQFEAGGAGVTYAVAYCFVRRTGDVPRARPDLHPI